MKPAAHAFLATVLALLLGACSSERGQPAAAGAPEAHGAADELTLCEEPRPEICTMDYRPVCGTHADGSRRTYSNGCSACSNPAVQGWTDGECP